MNFYVSIINKIVEHIENNIGENLQLCELSRFAGISDFHFNRMFSTVAGITLKQYITGRKLTYAAQQLKSTNKSIIDISMDVGFEYPEVFSRAFKKQFGLSPANFRENQPEITEVTKVQIVERDIINYRGVLALKGNSVYLESLKLYGINIKTNINSKEYDLQLKTKSEEFFSETAADSSYIRDNFYTIVTCSGNDNGDYNIFCGRKPAPDHNNINYYEYVIPEGWYVKFIYSGDMFDIREVFIDDLYKWIMVKEAELNPNGIGMLNIYENSYPENSIVQILVPIKKPV